MANGGYYPKMTLKTRQRMLVVPVDIDSYLKFGTLGRYHDIASAYHALRTRRGVKHAVRYFNQAVRVGVVFG